MRGLARNVNGQVFLAARAQCPQCGHQFNISCVIAPDKSVARCWVPTAFMLWWLSGLEPDTVVAESEPPRAEPEQASPAPIIADVQVSSEQIGSYGGQPIPAWVDWHGRRYSFLAIDQGQTLSSDSLRHAGMIFRRLEDKA